MRVWQEFYCNDCDGYVRFKVNAALKDHRVVVVCPNCNRKHPRLVIDGRVYDKSSGMGARDEEEVCPPKSAYSKEPWTKAMLKGKYRRDGSVIKNDSDLRKEIPSRVLVRSLWSDFFGARK